MNKPVEQHGLSLLGAIDDAISHIEYVNYAINLRQRTAKIYSILSGDLFRVGIALVAISSG